MALRLHDQGGDLPMERGAGDVWSIVVPTATAGTRYSYVLDGERARPDPRTRFQPRGVHGPSEVVDPSVYPWQHPRRPIALEDAVLYELHVGTFTPAGTFAAAAEAVPRLAADPGVTAIEIMPVAAFPGGRNWGYDGVYLYSPVAAYGHPDDLRRLVDAAHGAGLGVILDVVYNHLGPEGNYTSELAPYFTARRKTLWGDAVDYERREVRDWIVDNARSWIEDFRIDGLRLDAVHEIIDPSPRHILAELCERARPAVLIAETDMNDVKVFDEWGFDACWSDDFHHALHACLTGERDGYYRDFGALEHLARTIEEGWVRGPHPHRSRDLAAARLVVAAQTHDQIGNRALGERLAHLVPPSAARLAAIATLVAAPAVPMLFQGEEFAASAPFQYFTSHEDPDLARAVTEGRRREFGELGFRWVEQVPDPQDERTFRRSQLDHRERDREPHAGMARLYRDLLALRARLPGLGARAKPSCTVQLVDKAIHVLRGEVLVVLNFDSSLGARVAGSFEPILSGEDPRYGGLLDAPGHEVPPLSAAVFQRLG